MNIKDTIQAVKNIYMSDNSLSMLMDFERVLDNVDLYTFPNWEKGELVEGPVINKYFVRCKFMWPESKMPDPRGAKRLLPYGCKITYENRTIKMPVEIKKSDDYRPGSKKGKLVDVPVWVVDILMPKHLMKEIKQGSKEIAGEEIDLSDLQQAYEKSFDQKALINPQESEQVSSQPPMPAAPGGMPNVPPGQ